jgi:predicted protein tyrosine phosphatase
MEKILKIPRIIIRRFQRQGVITTLVWFYGRGVPFLTGIPLLRYSKITNQLYVGPQHRKWGRHRLEREGISGDVNLRIEFDDAQHGLALDHYCHLPTIDDEAPSMAHIDQGVRFIKELIDRGEKVYIHCAGGIGRAPTMAAAYLVHEGMALDEALSLIRAARPFITIMPPQMTLLQEYETRIRLASCDPLNK